MWGCRFDRLQQWQSVLAHRRGGFGVRYRFLGALFDKRENSRMPRGRWGSLERGEASMESGFHLGILRERPDVDVVLHFQSPYATAVACMKEIPRNFNVTAEVPCHVGSVIPVIPYFRPGSPELAEQVKAALKDHNSCLLRKHGQVVCGKDFDQAFERAMFFEMACRIIVLSEGRYEVLSQEEIDDLETYILGKKP